MTNALELILNKRKVKIKLSLMNIFMISTIRVPINSLMIALLTMLLYSNGRGSGMENEFNSLIKSSLSIKELCEIFSMNTSQIIKTDENKYTSFYESKYWKNDTYEDVEFRTPKDSNDIALLSVKISSSKKVLLDEYVDTEAVNEIDMSVLPAPKIRQVSYLINGVKVTFVIGWSDSYVSEIIVNYKDK